MSQISKTDQTTKVPAQIKGADGPIVGAFSPLKITAVRTYFQRVEERPRVLVGVETDAGITGWGEAYNHGPDRAYASILEYLLPLLQGEDPRRITFLHSKMLHNGRFPPGALGLAAIAAVDHALWDIAGKASGLPVYHLLGGNVRDRVRVYATNIYHPHPDEAVPLLMGMNEKYGIDAFKLSPYRIDPHSARWGLVCKAAGDYFAELRRRLPDHFEIAFDAHAVIQEQAHAVQLAQALEPYEPMFFEEPMRPEHMPAWGRLKAKLNVPLATGEALYNRFEFLALLQEGGADIIQPDIAVVGGLTEMRRIAEVADAHFVPVAPHNPMGPLATAHNLHFSAACPNFKILEYKVTNDCPWIKDPYLPVGGHLELRPDRPGWGVEIDTDALKVEDYVHWDRPAYVKPDGSTAYS